MKKVESIFRAHLLEGVKQALWDVAGVNGMTVSEVKGFSRSNRRTDTYRGVEYEIDFAPRVKLEVVVPDEAVDDCVAAVRRAALTGKHGDGKILVGPLDDVVRIRTGEHNERAV